MAFVFRCQNSNLPISASPPSTTYTPEFPKTQNRLYSAPFNQSSPRKIWKQNKTPGVGQYCIGQELCEQQKIIENIAQNIVVYQIPRQTCAFKSSTKRFENLKENLPSPGQYQLIVQKKPSRQNISSQKNQNKLQQYLKDINKQNKQENAGNLLFVAEETIQRQKQRSYHIFSKPEKINVPFNSKVGRDDKNRPQTSLGPGSYNIMIQKQCKDLKKRSKTKQVTKPVIKIQQNPLTNQKNSQNNPAFYESEIHKGFIKKSFCQRKEDFFGSTVTRFKENRTLSSTPGPGNYEISKNNQSVSVKKNIKKTAFGHIVDPTTDKQHFILTTHSQFVSKEEDINSYQKFKKVELKKDKKGTFGSKQIRFKQPIVNKQFQKSNFLQLSQYFCIQKQKKNCKKIKKIQSKNRLLIPFKFNKIDEQKQIFKQEIESSMKPEWYDTKSYTIQNKFGRKQQMKAPFMSQAIRFCSDHQNTLINDQDQKEVQAIRQEVVAIEKAKGPDWSRAKNPRFNYKEAQIQVNPQSYYPIYSNKKQFNTLFK